MSAPVSYSVERGVARISLDNVEARNAIGKEMLGLVAEHLAQAEDDSAVRAIVLTHSGGTFCAGGNLKEGAVEGGPGPGAERLLAVLKQMVESPKIIVGSVDGHVRAGGFGLIGACDIVVAGPSSTFALTEVRIGVTPAVISAVLLPKMTSRSASRYFATGETFDAVTAARIGVISEAVDDVEKGTAAVLDALRQGAPNALAEGKNLTSRAVRDAIESHGPALAALSQRMFASEDARQGMFSFLNKTAPEWVIG